MALRRNSGDAEPRDKFGTLTESHSFQVARSTPIQNPEADLLKVSVRYHPILGYLFEGNIPLSRQKEFIQHLRSLQTEDLTEIPLESPEINLSSVSEFTYPSRSLQTAEERFTYLNIPTTSNVKLNMSNERAQKKLRMPQVVDQHGWKWRKHGQKLRRGGNIRSYYRCSMRSSGCLATLVVNKFIVSSSGNSQNCSPIWNAKGCHNHDPPDSQKEAGGICAPLGMMMMDGSILNEAKSDVSFQYSN